MSVSFHQLHLAGYFKGEAASPSRHQADVAALLGAVESGGLGQARVALRRQLVRTNLKAQTR